MKPCPFCGDRPALSYRGWDDGHYYVEMVLFCCVTMSDHIEWQRANTMKEEDIKKELTASLTDMWNKRYDQDLEEQVITLRRHISGIILDIQKQSYKLARNGSLNEWNTAKELLRLAHDIELKYTGSE